MSSYVHICPGCGDRYRDPQTFLWHTESCDSSESLSWVDRQGDVWRVGEDGLMHTPETAPFPREYVEKKWGPLRLFPEVAYR